MKNSADIEETISRHRCSTQFLTYQKTCDLKPHIYYQFLEWWMKEKLSKGTLDPTGAITQALLENAAGFGGWSRDKHATGEEVNIYNNTAFFHYWQHQDAPHPQKNTVLDSIWKAAREKQCLFMPHDWLYPVGKAHACEEPRDVVSWYHALSSKGWNMRTHSADVVLNDLFLCCNSENFQKEVAKRLADGTSDMVQNWFDLSLAFAKQPHVTHADNPLESALRGLLKGNPQALDYKMCFSQVMQEQLPTCQRFWHKLKQTDVSNLNIESGEAHLQTVNLLLKSYAQRRRGMSLASLMEDGDHKELWTLQQDSELPYAILEEAVTSHNDLHETNQIFERALTKIQDKREKYGSLACMNELMRYVPDYLSLVVKANEIHRHTVMIPGYIFGEFMAFNTELDEEQNDLADLHARAHAAFTRVTNVLRNQIGIYQLISYRLENEAVILRTEPNPTAYYRDHRISITREERSAMVDAEAINQDFFRFTPVMWRERCFERQYDPRCNLSQGDEATILHHTGRAVDFLIQRQIIPSYDKLRILLGLQDMAML